LEVDAIFLTVDRLLHQAHRATMSTTAKRTTRRTRRKMRMITAKAHQEAVQTLKVADVATDVMVAVALDAAVTAAALMVEVSGVVLTMVDHTTVITAAAAAGVHGLVAVPSVSVAAAAPSIP
jgi:phage-related baseplate assembly protein